MDKPVACTTKVPPDSFTPAVQWSYAGDALNNVALANPLVVNLTDDNSDGVVDMCDVPDVIVLLYPQNNPLWGNLYVLDGETGALHYRIDDPLLALAHPAVGDIDGDGVAEIVALRRSFAPGVPLTGGELVAYNHDGTELWAGAVVDFGMAAAFAIADLENDGTPNVMVNRLVADHMGNEMFDETVTASIPPLATAADLDGDSDLEVIFGSSAYHHDGSLFFDAGNSLFGNPHVANLDDDDDPEILVTTEDGAAILEHDGTVKVAPSLNTRRVPAAIHNVVGDEQVELILPTVQNLLITSATFAAYWTSPIEDPSGIAGGTAFDFTGSGFAQAMYADETNLRAFDDAGLSLMLWPRSSRTQTEYPVVADVDGDGSAEVVVVSSETIDGSPSTAPAVQVIRDETDRWVPARRVWNQHTYHVTNVREDGTIPVFEAPHWLELNTFRTQAQVEVNGDVCEPPQ